MSNYIFGYGSLLEERSRLRTNPSIVEIYPVKVYGFLRGWFARTGVEGLTTTFLGCIVSSPDSYVNGVIYKISDKELDALDKREKGYERIRIEIDSIDDYTSILETTDNVFIYSNHFPNNAIPESFFPCEDFPIVQSYVDMCLTGCLEIERSFTEIADESFCKDFIESTKYWNTHWVNDRIYPRRPFIYRPDAYRIDELLKKYLPDDRLLESIYFE